MLNNLPAECEREDAAALLLEELRWGNAARCPRCANLDVYRMLDRVTGRRSIRFLWRCRSCEKQFSVRVGTLFENSTIDLYKWCRAFYEASRNPGGVTGARLAKILDITPRSAASIIRRINEALGREDALGLILAKRASQSTPDESTKSVKRNIIQLAVGCTRSEMDPRGDTMHDSVPYQHNQRTQRACNPPGATPARARLVVHPNWRDALASTVRSASLRNPDKENGPLDQAGPPDRSQFPG